jgi:chemotaxis protein methyltransferase CheR
MLRPGARAVPPGTAVQEPDVVWPAPGVLPARVFAQVRKLVYDKAGIDLRPGKEALVTARLSRRLRESGCPSYQAFVDRAARDATGEGLVELIDALTTNFTSFLREPSHFEFMRRKVLPALVSRASVDIWCAAAATGEEPYSIAFTLLDMLALEALGAGARPRVLATDISTQALERARRGVYPAERFSGVPRAWLHKYLLKGTGEATGLYRVRPEVARVVEFRRLNLVEPMPPFVTEGGRAHAGVFPLIWCRNVMIYFDTLVQQRVVTALEQRLEPGGYLFVGHSESLSGIRHSLEYVQPAIYRRPL